MTFRLWRVPKFPGGVDSHHSVVSSKPTSGEVIGERWARVSIKSVKLED